MLNTASWDPLQVTHYVAEYLDLVESLPFDLQRNVSLMREIDAKYQGNVLGLFTPQSAGWGWCVCREEEKPCGASEVLREHNRVHTVLLLLHEKRPQLIDSFWGFLVLTGGVSGEM